MFLDKEVREELARSLGKPRKKVQFAIADSIEYPRQTLAGRLSATKKSDCRKYKL
jgi:hypothetical protein